MKARLSRLRRRISSHRCSTRAASDSWMWPPRTMRSRRSPATSDMHSPLPRLRLLVDVVGSRSMERSSDPDVWRDVTGGAVAERVRRLLRVTPLVPAPALGRRTGADVWLKLENLQRTGSFKLRGAAARLAALSIE